MFNFLSAIITSPILSVLGGLYIFSFFALLLVGFLKGEQITHVLKLLHLTRILSRDSSKEISYKIFPFSSILFLEAL